MGFGGLIKILLKSYLKNREKKYTLQRYRILIFTFKNWCNSRLFLEPILFILYVNDLPEAIVNLTLNLYADDTALKKLSQSHLSQLILGMKQAIDWLDRKKSTLNFD